MYMLHMTGAGDVKLLAAVGAMVGCSDFMGIFLLTALIGGVLAIILMLVKGRVRQTLWNVGLHGERTDEVARSAPDARTTRRRQLQGAAAAGRGADLSGRSCISGNGAGLVAGLARFRYAHYRVSPERAADLLL